MMESNGQSANSINQRNSIQNTYPREYDDNNQKVPSSLKSAKDTRDSADDQEINKSREKSREKSKDRKVFREIRQKKHRKRDSRSNSSSESRSKRKEKKGKKHRKRSSQSFENKGRSSRSRSERGSRHRRNSRDRKHKRRNNSKERSRSSHRKQQREEKGRAKEVQEFKEVKENKEEKETPKMPEEVPFQQTTYALPGQRRRRQRSRSPRDYYRRNAGGGNDAEFWNSHSWVPKLNYISNASSSAIINTKKMRRLQITNVPLEMGLKNEDINQIITEFMIKNYLTDNMNTCPILKLDIFEADRSVALELSSVEETCRICKMEKAELFKGSFCGIIRLGDSMYGSSLVSQAQAAAKAQAAAFAAISILQNKATKFDYSGGMVSIQSSNVLRVVNAVTPYMADHLTEEEWKEYYQDLTEGFAAHGKVKHSWLVKKSQRMVCAEPGNLFIEYEKKEEAEKAMEEMQGRNFDERELALYFIPTPIWLNHFKPNSVEK